MAGPGVALRQRGSPYAGPLEARSFARPLAFPFAARPGGQMEGVVPWTHVPFSVMPVRGSLACDATPFFTSQPV